MNEGTVREWAKMGTQNTPAKNFHRSGSIGPWLVTADEIDDPGKLHITTRRNGAVVQDGGTELMIFDLPYLIAHISKFAWLEPGDMIATGSPGGYKTTLNLMCMLETSSMKSVTATSIPLAITMQISSMIPDITTRGARVSHARSGYRPG